MSSPSESSRHATASTAPRSGSERTGVGQGGAFVLLLADDRRDESHLEGDLRGCGHDVVTAQSIADALAQLHGADFDLALVALADPVRGLEILKALRRISTDTEVVLVAPRMGCNALELVRQGAFDVIVRPLTRGAVEMAIGRAVERRRLRTITSLHQASQAIVAHGKAETLPRVIVDNVARALEGDIAALSVFGADGEPGTWISAEKTGQAADSVLPRAIVLRIAASGMPALLPDDAPNFGIAPEEVGLARTAIVMPLTVGDGRLVLTVARVNDPRPYRRTDLERIAVLATQSHLALQNARLVERMLDGERLATIGRLAAGVAHEVNNPLSYVLGNQEIAKERVASLRQLLDVLARQMPIPEDASVLVSEIEEALEDVGDGARRIGAIARDLRTLARGHAPSVERVDLNAAIRGALRITASELRAKVDVVVDLAESAVVVGHEGRLTQVIVNLLANAAQAASACSHKVQVHVATRIEGSEVVATVTDTGPGISPENLGRLFDPFFSTKAAKAGTGLGLSITKSIVAEHGGSIVCKSTEGQGATFVVRLASAPSPAKDDSRAAAERKAPRRMRILVVDDEVNLLRTYERILGRRDDVVTASGGKLALELLTREPGRFDAILCDLVMPDLLGSEVYRRACAIDPSLARRFVFATGMATHPDARDFLASTDRPVLEKPFTGRALEAVLAPFREASLGAMRVAAPVSDAA